MSDILIPLAIVAAILNAYFLPTGIAMWRGHPWTLAIFAGNLLFGWTFVGWGLAVVVACTGRRSRAACSS